MGSCIEHEGEFCGMEPPGKWCWMCGHSELGIRNSLEEWKAYQKKHPMNYPLLMWMEAPVREAHP